MNNETLLRTVESYKEWESLIEEAKKEQSSSDPKGDIKKRKQK